MTLAELAERLGCRLEGDGAATIVGVADLATAHADEVALFAHPRYKAQAAATQAGAVIVAEDAPALARPLLRSKSPFLAFARALAIFHTPPRPAPGISQVRTAATFGFPRPSAAESGAMGARFYQRGGSGRHAGGTGPRPARGSPS